MESRRSLQNALSVCTPSSHQKAEDFFCCTCTALFCAACVKQHSGHSFIDGDEEESMSEELRQLLEAMQPQDAQDCRTELLEVSAKAALVDRNTHQFEGNREVAFAQACEKLRLSTEKRVEIALLQALPVQQSLHAFREEIAVRVRLAESEERAVKQRLAGLRACQTPFQALQTARLEVVRVVLPVEVQKGLEWACGVAFTR